MKNLATIITAIFFVMIMVTATLSADVPELINYQGHLTDAIGDPVPDASYTITFTIYTTAIGSNSKWTETQSVTTSDGAFSVLLGSVNPIKDTVFNAIPRYLGIKVYPDPEITPRTNLVTVPYAFQSQNGGGWTDTGTRIKLISLNDTVIVSDTDTNPQGKLHVNSSASGTSARLATSSQGVHGTGPTAVYGNGTSYGVRGYSQSGYAGYFTSWGVFPTVWGENGNLLTFGALGHANGGVYGARAVGTGVSYGALGHDSASVYGLALSNEKIAVYGKNDAGQNYGFLGDSAFGVYGYATGLPDVAVAGFHDDGPYGALGTTDVGVFGYSGNLEDGTAGYFYGDVVVNGNLSKSSGSFKIDHPDDPANKWLYHSFVESPDMMNVYNGNVVTDMEGYSTVVLPDYFESLNKDFRYQLTVIGQFAQAIVAEKIAGGKFLIRTDKPNVEVSWQVTGIRQDPYAERNRIVVDVKKSANEIGRYAHPEVYDLPASFHIKAELLNIR